MIVCSSLNQPPIQTEARPSPLSSQPKRTRISCCAAVDRAACAAFRKESRMKLAEPTNFNRKSGGAKWRDLQFHFRSIKAQIRLAFLFCPVPYP